MIKKTILFLCFATMSLVANEYFVKVELTEERLNPLQKCDLRVIAELEHYAIVLADDSDLPRVITFAYEIIDYELEDSSYYLVLPMDSNVELYRFGKILLIDDDTYLMRIKESMHEELMKEKIMIKRLLLMPIIFKSETPLPRVLFDPTVQEIVNLIDSDTVLTSVQRLQDFITRFSEHDSCLAAANYIAGKFNAYGCDSVFFQNHTANHAPNVIGVKYGMIYPDSIYTLVCGHFDSYSNAAPPIAPGADDNASGTTCVIEAARVMKDYDFEYSVRYIAFSGEEYGLYGSQYYAALARANGDSIIGVFNADMIGYVDALPESLEVVAKNSNPPCGPLADFFIAAADTYTALLTRKRMTDYYPWSDHQSFWENGYIALHTIEDSPLNNPHYHTTHDTIGAGYNNNDFCTDVIRAETAALSVMAVPYEHGIDESTLSNYDITRFRISPTIARTHVNIVFMTNDKETVNLKVYNAAGLLVKSFNNIAAKSVNQIIWDGTDGLGQKLPSGIYFLRLETRIYKETIKVTLIR